MIRLQELRRNLKFTFHISIRQWCSVSRWCAYKWKWSLNFTEIPEIWRYNSEDFDEAKKEFGDILIISDNNRSRRSLVGSV